MKIKNETQYDTRYLRRLFMACEKYAIFWKMCGPHSHKSRSIRVIKCKGQNVHGLAWYRTHSLVMKLPINPSKPISARKVAGVYIHEVEHNSGKHHREMADWWKRPIDFWPDEAVPMKVQKAKPKISAAAKRETQARKNLAAWQVKLARAKSFERKWRTKVRYYDRKAAAANQDA